MKLPQPVRINLPLLKDRPIDEQAEHADTTTSYVTMTPQSEVNSIWASGGRFKDRKEGQASSTLCYYHYKYGNKELKCKKCNAEGTFCPMHEKWAAKNKSFIFKKIN